MESVYERISRLLSEKGVSGYRMCSDLGLSRSFMTELRKGRTKNVSSQNAEKISDYFGVSVDYLLTGEENKKSPLSKEKGDLILTQALKGTPLLDPDGQLNEKGKKIISDFITNNVDMLKQLMNEPE